MRTPRSTHHATFGFIEQLGLQAKMLARQPPLLGEKDSSRYYKLDWYISLINVLTDTRIGDGMAAQLLKGHYHEMVKSQMFERFELEHLRLFLIAVLKQDPAAVPAPPATDRDHVVR